MSSKKLNPSLKNQITKTFAQTIADLKDFNELHAFFKDFLNESEYETFAKRLAIAYWLMKGRSYKNIKDNLKVSSATIADVAFAMKRKGFLLALKKLEAEEWATKWAQKIRSFTKVLG